MTREDVAVGLDIGTTKVCTVVGHGDAQGKITIAGVGVVPSRGLRKGVVIDVEDTVTAIRDSVERARHMAGMDFDSAIAGVTGDHIQSSNLRGTVTAAAANQVITQEDVDRVLQAANLDVPRDREIIHSLPRYFAVDGQRGVRRPVGMCGQRLEVETHVVTGTASFLNNVKQCVERAGLEVDALVLEPIATSEAVATPDERELGVALIDIGGGTSDIAVFQEGSIVFSAVLPVGGNHVTRDISIGLRTPFDIAERLKIERGVASPDLIPHGEALEVMTAGSGERLRLPRAVLGEIIEARMSELFEMARNAIVEAGVQNRLPAGLILSGGGAMLPGVTDLAQQIFESPVRVGKPIELLGWSDQVDTPQFSTGVGLLRYGLRQRNAATATVTATAVTAGQPATDYQRRIWSMPAAPAGSEAARAAGMAAQPPYAQEGVSDEEPVEAPAEFAQSTPFDRLRRQNGRGGSDHAGGDRTGSERADNVPPTIKPPATPQSPWQKFLTKLRQLIGFEMS
ncbi:MAG: cell division protein FtsA [Armatimonadota bacterium]|nr:cell division protein FtsA [Armatimonadota bacterium]